MRINIRHSFNTHHTAGGSHHGGHHRFDGSALAMMAFGQEMKE